MTCMHSSLITYFLTNLHTHTNCYLPFLALKHITFTILSNTYPISGYSIRPDSVYSLDFRGMKQRKKNHMSFLLLPYRWENVVMLMLVVCRVFNKLGTWNLIIGKCTTVDTNPTLPDDTVPIYGQRLKLNCHHAVSQ